MSDLVRGLTMTCLLAVSLDGVPPMWALFCIARASAGWVIQNYGITTVLVCAGLFEVAISTVGYLMPVVQRYGKTAGDGSSSVQAL